MTRGLVAVVVVVALVGPASAQPTKPPPPPPSDVVQVFQSGIDAFRLGKYTEARALLEKARGMDPTLPGPHRFLAAVAQVERRWEDCISSARAAIALKPDSSESAATRTIHDACRTGLGRAAFTGTFGDGGAIAVFANIEGATVALGGLRYGATPLAPRALAAGTVEVVVEKTGWLTARVEAEVLPQLVTDVVVELQPDPAANIDHNPGGIDPTTHGWLLLGDEPISLGATVQIDGAAVPISPSIALTSGVHEVQVEAPGRERWRRRVRITRGQRTSVAVALPTHDERAGRRKRAYYVFAGAGALAVVGAGAALISWRAAEEGRDIWQVETSRPQTVPLDQTGMIEPVHTRADLDDARSRARTWSYVSLASYGLAIAGAGVGAYLLLRDRPDEVEGEPAPFAIAPIVGPDGIGAAVTMRGELDW